MSSGRVLFLPKGTALRNHQLVGTYQQLGAWIFLTRQSGLLFHVFKN